MAQQMPAQIAAMGVNPPCNIEAEQAVLGAAIVDSATLYDVAPILSAEHFYSEQNAAIYRVILLLFSGGKPIDFVTVLNEVAQAGIFENEAAAKVYLYDISQTVPTLANVASYARIVYDKYLLRSLLAAAGEIIAAGSQSSDSAESLLDLAEQKIYSIRQGRDNGELKKLDEVIISALDHLNKLSGPDREKYLGIRTGFERLDSLLTGLNRSDLIILAARPGVGKTSFALNIASNVVKAYDISVAVFSLEMSKRQLAERILSSEGGISSESLRMGNLSDSDWKSIVTSANDLAGANLFIDDTSSVSVTEIKAKSRRLKNLGLIVVDYLQLMGGNRRSESRVQEISDITRAFKIMAKELDVPILLLSQLSRGNEKEKRRPVLSDLRDSGSIEQDADIVMLLHKNVTEENPYPDECDCIVAKNRHGSVDTVHLHWDGAHTRFTTLDMRQDDYE